MLQSAQQTALLTAQGIDFDYGRDVRDLQKRGVTFSNFGEAPGEARIIDLDVFLKDLGDAIKLATEGRAGDSAAETKKRREGTLPQAGELGVESVVGAAPPAPVVRDLAAVVGASPVVFSTEIESILTEMRTDIASIASEGVIVRNVSDIFESRAPQPQGGLSDGARVFAGCPGAYCWRQYRLRERHGYPILHKRARCAGDIFSCCESGKSKSVGKGGVA